MNSSTTINSTTTVSTNTTINTIIMNNTTELLELLLPVDCSIFSLLRF